MQQPPNYAIFKCFCNTSVLASKILIFEREYGVAFFHYWKTTWQTHSKMHFCWFMQGSNYDTSPMYQSAPLYITLLCQNHTKVNRLASISFYVSVSSQKKLYISDCSPENWDNIHYSHYWEPRSKEFKSSNLHYNSCNRNSSIANINI